MERDALGWMGDLTHECSRKLWTLVRCRWSKVSHYVGTVLSANDRVLVLVAYATTAGKGFTQPVGRADKGRLCVDILLSYQHHTSHQCEATGAVITYVRTLLLPSTKCTLIQCRSSGLSRSGKVWDTGVD